MGPFARATRKKSSGHRTGGQSPSSEGFNSSKETDQKASIQHPLDTNRSGIHLKEKDSRYKDGQKGKAMSGQESIQRTSSLQKEYSQGVYNPSSRGKNKTKLEGDRDALRKEKCQDVSERLHDSDVDDLGENSKMWKQSLHAETLQDASDQAVSLRMPWKADDNYTRRSEIPVVTAEKVEGKDSKADQFVTEANMSNFSFPLGLNRIKTRSGPLQKEGFDAIYKCTGSQNFHGSLGKSGLEEVDKILISNMPRQYGSSKQVDVNRRDPNCSPGKEMSEMSDEGYQKVGTLLGDSRFRDLGMVGDSKSSKPYRTYESPQKRSMKGIMDVFVTSVSSQAETHCNPLCTTSQPTDFTFSKESQKQCLKTDYALEKNASNNFTSNVDNKSSTREGACTELDVVKERESTRFHAVQKVSAGVKTKKWPKDIKSFSHELEPRNSRPYGHPRAHSDNDLEELLGALHARFDIAKEEVDSELGVFAADLVEILDKNTDPFPEWQEKVEDLLVLARHCSFMSAGDFRRECESIVQDLDNKRQELAMGLLKQLHTRMLFILTQCTRLLQFQKGSTPEEEGLHKVQQCLKGVPSLERSYSKRGKLASNNKKLLTDLLERTSRNDGNILATKHLKYADKSKHLFPNHSTGSDPSVARHSSSVNKSNTLVGEAHDKTETTDHWVTSNLKESTIRTLEQRWDYLETARASDDDESQEAIIQSGTCLKNAEQEGSIDEQDSVICRICEEEVPTSQLEAHSFLCALADTCDIQGLSLDERLRMLADNLEKLTDLNTPKSFQPTVGESPDSIKPFRFLEGSDGTSPKVNDNYGRASQTQLEDFYAFDTTTMEEPKGISIFSFKPYLGPKSDQGFASSSAGSGTPRSTLTTPRNSQLDLLWAEKSSLTELEDVSQICELADIARCVANKSPLEDGALEYLAACMQDLQDVLGRNKIEALIVETFGKRIANDLREKYLLICESNDQRKLDLIANPIEEEIMSVEDGLSSLKSTPTHPVYKDRITIDDFVILKPISRGAFGRVFLARKRTTGDLFAIKVLRKIDMIRKNAVENILAERDILISVRNPFVVRFFYSFTSRDNLYLVMEYLNGGDLYSLVRNMGCLEEHVARIYIAELVLALEYLHSLGVVHRDLKPDNILIAHDGHIKLTDFGLSKVGLINSTDDLSGPAASGTVLTDEDTYRVAPEQCHSKEHRSHSAVGTPDYLAPEILLGTEHGYTADWWSTGIILFELLTGLPPFNAEHPQIIFDNILNRKIPWPRVPEEMSCEAEDLIDKLLTQDPNQRLGAKGASEVKSHPFFKDINWDTLARQKAVFVPNPESADDTSYFMSRHLLSHLSSPHELMDSSDCSLSSASIGSVKARAEEGEDECGDLAEFESSPSVKHTFNNFSFKNLSQLASINYDLLLQTGKDISKGHSRHSSVS